MSLEKSESIRHASRQIIRELGFLNKFPKYEDMSASQIHILMELNTFGQLSGSELADRLQLDKSTISRSTSLLLDKGWINVDISESDGRSKNYALTSSGLDRVRLSNIRAHRIVFRALSQLPKEDQESVMKGLTLYGNALEKARKVDWTIETLKNTDDLNSIVHFINHIQISEFFIPVSEAMNANLYEAASFYRDTTGAINFWVARDSKGVVGTLGLKQLSHTQGEIKKFFVRADLRRSGVAVELMSYLIQRSNDLGIKTLYLGTVERLKAAQRFYEKMGFERITKKQLPQGFEVCEVDTEFFRFHL